jgi:hypothetical protein
MSFFPTKKCSILSFDYLDFDVYLNIVAFYHSAGYQVSLDSVGVSSDLVIVLRGWPPHIYNDYTGDIHVYDYVKELSIDYSKFFPRASRLFYISITPDPVRDFSATSPNIYIHGYLPVIPEIWTSLAKRKTCSKPLHIANYKPMSADLYQSQLITLANQQFIKIYGAKWHMVGIASSSVSYWAANQLLAKASHCFGLMYPYQRGKSLSGRMWQAPINGCVVISEAGTNIFGCPGIVECEDYLLISRDLPPSSYIASQSISFWKGKTRLLALHLGLTLSKKTDHLFIQYLRWMLFWKHILFCWHRHIVVPMMRFRSIVISFIRRLLLSF